MRKLALALLTAALCLSFFGCGMRFTLDLPFAAADITSVEMYYYTDPNSAQRRNIVDKDDIRDLYSYFSSLNVRSKESQTVSGGEVISFRFNLSDSSSYEIIYYAQTTDSGCLSIPSTQLSYYTSTNLCELWTKYSEYQAVSVNKSVLPGVT